MKTDPTQKHFSMSSPKMGGNSISRSKNNGVNSANSSFEFVDNRFETVAQLKLNKMVNRYFNSQKTLQKKENNTGLPDQLKSGIEQLSGYTMDDVKVHRNSDKPSKLQAHAYAQGTDIHLGPGQEKHLAHEAWHVVQQKQGRVKPTMQMKGVVPVNDETHLESEADIMGQKALNYTSHSNSAHQHRTQLKSVSKVVQKKPFALNPKDPSKLDDAADWDLKKKMAWNQWWDIFRDTNQSLRIPGDTRNKCLETYNEFAAEIEHHDNYDNNEDYKLKYDFDQALPDKKFKRNDPLIEQALNLITAFENKEVGLRIKATRKNVADRLKEVIQNPEVMDQKQYPLCGPDAMIRSIALYNPLAYAKYAIDLLEKGKGKIGSKTIVMPDSVKDKKSVSATKMDPTDWSLTASLRLQKNKGYSKIRSDYDKVGPQKWHSSLGGATTHGTMKDWVKAIGIQNNAIASKSTMIFGKTNVGDIKTINAEYGLDKAVALIINPNIINNKVNTDVDSSMLYKHWVLLTSPIELLSNNYIAEVYTWGAKKKLVFKSSNDQINNAIKGYLAYDLSKLAIG